MYIFLIYIYIYIYREREREYFLANFKSSVGVASLWYTRRGPINPGESAKRKGPML